MPRMSRGPTLHALLIALGLCLFTTAVVLAADPPLTFVEVVKDTDAGVDGIDDIRGVALSPDGKHLYTAAGIPNAVAVFSRNSTTGALTFDAVHRDGVLDVDGLSGAISVSVSPDGKHVYAAGINDNAVAVFSRDPDTGALIWLEVLKNGTGGVLGLSAIRWVTVSPDGKHVYTASSSDSAIALFTRDSGTGLLTWVEIKKDGVGVVDGLLASRSVTVSPDGKHVYATGSAENEVAVFSRDSMDGTLTFVERVKQGEGGVDGLFTPLVVVVSPDGKNVYVTGNAAGGAVVVFSRNSTSGVLSFVEVQEDGEAGVDGIEGAFPVTVSPDGLRVYAGGSQGNQVAVFSRDPATGALTFNEAHKDGLLSVDGLGGPSSVTASPDGKHVYFAGQSDDAVAIFSVPAAGLSMAKSANRAFVAATTNLTYTLTATNNGPSDAGGISVTDVLPGGVTFVAASAGCSEAGGTVTCATASLANGASVEFTITVTVAGTPGANFANTASVTTASFDDDASDDAATAVVKAANPPGVPGLTTWGIVALALGLGTLVLVARRRRAALLR